MEFLQFDRSLLIREKELIQQKTEKKDILSKKLDEIQRLKAKGVTLVKQIAEVQKLYLEAVANKEKDILALEQEVQGLDTQIEEAAKKSEEEAQSLKASEEHLQKGSSVIAEFGIVLKSKHTNILEKPVLKTLGEKDSLERTAHWGDVMKQITSYMEGPGVAPIDGKFIYDLDTVEALADKALEDYEAGINPTEEYMLAMFSKLDCSVNRRALEEVQTTTQSSNEEPAIEVTSTVVEPEAVLVHQLTELKTEEALVSSNEDKDDVISSNRTEAAKEAAINYLERYKPLKTTDEFGVTHTKGYMDTVTGDTIHFLDEEYEQINKSYRAECYKCEPKGIVSSKESVAPTSTSEDIPYRPNIKDMTEEELLEELDLATRTIRFTRRGLFTSKFFNSFLLKLRYYSKDNVEEIVSIIGNRISKTQMFLVNNLLEQ